MYWMRIVPSICISPLKPTDRFNFTENKYKVVRFKMIYTYTKVLFSRYDLFFWNAEKWSNKIIFHAIEGRDCLEKKMVKTKSQVLRSYVSLFWGFFPKVGSYFWKRVREKPILLHLYIWYCCYCFFFLLYFWGKQ